MAAKESRLVYSTDTGDQRKTEIRNPLPLAGNTDKPVRISADNKGRKGKFVTLISNLPGGTDAIEKLGREIRVHCGTGGSVTDEGVLVQGDHRQKIATFLQARGFKVKVI